MRVPKGEGSPERKKTMAKKRSVMWLAVLVLFLAASFLKAAPPAGPAFRTVHLFSLSSAQEEGRLRAALEEFNRLFSKLGYPQVSYRLWKVQGSASDQFTHLYDSTWPDQATYDKVHQNSTYKKLLEKHLPFLQQVLKNETYSKCIELKAGGKKP
jgi:hypothetical protein